MKTITLEKILTAIKSGGFEIVKDNSETVESYIVFEPKDTIQFFHIDGTPSYSSLCGELFQSGDSIIYSPLNCGGEEQYIRFTKEGMKTVNRASFEKDALCELLLQVF